MHSRHLWQFVVIQYW
jgi:hypothetical protein